MRSIRLALKAVVGREAASRTCAARGSPVSAPVFGVIRTCTGFMLRYFFEWGVPKYGNSLRTSVCGLRPVGGH